MDRVSRLLIWRKRVYCQDVFFERAQAQFLHNCHVTWPARGEHNIDTAITNRREIAGGPAKAEQSSIKHQTNVQINDNSTFGEGNYGELMKKLLESG